MTGIPYAEVELLRAADLELLHAGYITENQVQRVQVVARVEQADSMLGIPRALAQQLNLRTVDEVQAELSTGEIRLADITEPVELRFQNRRAAVSAMILDTETEVRLGRIPLASMDLVVDLEQGTLDVNPKSPDVARMLLKSPFLRRF